RNGHPSARLPDCRAYEQATPLDKDGGDALTKVTLAAAAPDGTAVMFAPSHGIPGGVGSQDLPQFRASRSPSGWSSTGLFPPASEGDPASLAGRATRLSRLL